MNFKEASKEEKAKQIKRIKGVFKDIHRVLNDLETDIESPELMEQACSVWISGQLCSWFNDFMTEIKKFEQSKKNLDKLKDELEAANDKN